MELLQLVQRLSKANGPTGYETGAVKAAQTLLQGLVQQTTIDAMGNLIGILPSGKDGAKRIVLDAHLDEVCLVVTGHEEGFLKVQSSFGGVDPRLPPATRGFGAGGYAGLRRSQLPAATYFNGAGTGAAV